MSEGKTPPRSREHALDTALASWPEVEKPAAHWESAAERVEKAIASGHRARTAADVSDEALLAPPLAQAAEDGQRGASGSGVGKRPSASDIASEGRMALSSRERDRKSFQDLAKLASGMTPPPASVRSAPPSGVHRAQERPERKEDSGVVDLQSLAADEAAASARPASERGAAPAPAVAQAAPVAAAAVAQTALPLRAADNRARRTAIYAISGVIALAALAAGTVFVVKGNRSASANRPTAAEVETGAPRADRPLVAATQTATTAKDPIAAVNAPLSSDGVDPSDLPAANNGTTAPLTRPLPPNGTKLALAPTSTAKDKEPPAPVALAPSVAATAPAATGPATANTAVADDKALQDAIMRQAAGTSPSAAPEATAAPEPTNVPLKPSQGAVSAALSRVVGGARACLSSEDGTSTASVVFRSNGSVQSVSVSGSAQGTPAEACIRAALSRAAVSPFGQATFTGFVVVRPN